MWFRMVTTCWSAFANRSRRTGFSLMEVVVVLAVLGALAAMIVPLSYQLRSAQRERETRTLLENLKQAMVGGDPATRMGEERLFGFLGDMGRLPDTLAELWERGTLPQYTIDSETRLGAGWRGPYAWPGFEQDVADRTKDPFGRALRYSSADSTTPDGRLLDGVLQSAGEDGEFGTSDDVTVPILKDETRAALLVGFVADSSGAAQAGVNVQVTFRRNGLLVDTVVVTSAQGRYELANIPFGQVRIAALASGPSGGPGGIQFVPNSVSTDGEGHRNVRLQIFNASATPRTINSLRVIFPKDRPQSRFFRIELGGVNLVDRTEEGIDSGEVVPIPSVTLAASGTLAGTLLTAKWPVIDRPQMRAPDLFVPLGGGMIVASVLRLEHFIESRNLSPNPRSNQDMRGRTLTIAFSDGSSFTFTTPRF